MSKINTLKCAQSLVFQELLLLIKFSANMKENFDILFLKKNNPNFATALLTHDNDEEHKLKLICGLDETFEVDGIQLTSRHSRKTQAEKNLKNINTDADVHVYGIGLGDEIRILQSKITPSHKIYVYVLCPKLLLQLLECTQNFAPLFKQTPNTEFILDNFPDKLPENRLCILPELILEPAFQNRTKLKLRTALDCHYSQKIFKKTGENRIKKALLKNAEALKREQALQLAKLSSCSQAIVIASGPSLEHTFTTIKALRKEGAVTIAAETALTYLESQNFIPDYVITIDDLAGGYAGDKFMKDMAAYRSCILLYAPWSNQKIWKNYSGPHVYIPFAKTFKYLPMLKKTGDSLWCSGSVMHAQTALAVALGADKVFLAGVDLCYDGEYTHVGIKKANDPYISGDTPCEILCNDGKLRPTQGNFMQYLEDLEDYIAVHPEVEFVNLSERGARIKGCAFIQTKDNI